MSFAHCFLPDGFLFAFYCKSFCVLEHIGCDTIWDRLAILPALMQRSQLCLHLTFTIPSQPPVRNTVSDCMYSYHHKRIKGVKVALQNVCISNTYSLSPISMLFRSIILKKIFWMHQLHLDSVGIKHAVIWSPIEPALCVGWGHTDVIASLPHVCKQVFTLH